MSEEFLAKQDSHFYWLVAVSVFFVVSFFISYFATRRLSEKRKKLIGRKFLLVNLCVFLIYIFLSIPYTGFFYSFGSNKQYPTELSSNEKVSEYVKNHHHRIETLESQVKESREELRLLRDHYKNLIYITMVFVLSFTGSQIFSSTKDEDLEDIKPDKI